MKQRTLGTLALFTLIGCESATEPATEPKEELLRWSATPVAVSGELVFSSISAGGAHTCGVTADGAAYCWGNNGDGQLGVGTTSQLGPSGLGPSYRTPTPVVGGLRFTSISAAGTGTCGLTTGGELYCWGRHDGGELLLSNHPVQVPGGHRYTSLRVGELHRCALTTAGEAFCWGRNGDGELGTGISDYNRHPAPERVSGDHTFTAIAVGESFTCGITAAGVYCWGRRWGNLPKLVTRLTLKAISAGGSTACGIALDGIGHCWGGNGAGQLGRGSVTAFFDPDPSDVAPVVSVSTLASISNGAKHACAVDERGIAYCWGANSDLGSPPVEDGRLGRKIGGAQCDPIIYNNVTSYTLCSAVPARVSTDLTFAAVSAGGRHSCSLMPSGKAYCWGDNGSGQLGSTQ
jgi:alpha-tubulin suppressor-like RCC1 family protein